MELFEPMLIFELVATEKQELDEWKHRTEHCEDGLKDCAKATIAMIQGYCMGGVSHLRVPVILGFVLKMQYFPFRQLDWESAKALTLPGGWSRLLVSLRQKKF